MVTFFPFIFAMLLRKGRGETPLVIKPEQQKIMRNHVAKRHRYAFEFHSLRNISSPEDTENGRKILTGQCPIQSILDLSTDENVRGYLVEAEGKMRKRLTSVHRAIRETLLETPHNFSVLNSGIVIVARDIELPDKDKEKNKAVLINPSIINGAQTQGILRDLNKAGLLPKVHVKYEIIVTDDEDIIADTSIARNNQNDVADISIAGRKGQLDELEKKIIEELPMLSLRKSETQWPTDDTIDTEKLLQVMTALIPGDLWLRTAEGENQNRVYTYSAKAKCLRDYQEIYEKANNVDHPEHSENLAVYNFFLDIASDAWMLYLNWKAHQGFRGTKLRAIERENGEIVDVPDGIIFPILSALSVFTKKSRGHWKFEFPANVDDEIIKSVKSIYMDMAGSDPQKMGKSRACYSALLQLTSLYKRLSK